MNFIIFISGIILAYAGSLIGAIIAHNSKRELKQGERYFIGLQKAVLVLFLLTPLMFSMQYGLLLLALLLIMAIFIISKPDLYAYVLFAIILPYSAVDPLFFATMCFLAFLYGLPSQALKPEKKTALQGVIRAAKEHAPFAATAIILGIVFSVLSIAP